MNRENENMEDDLRRDFEELDFFEPSMRFSKNTIERVKKETSLIRQQKGPLYWLPKVFVWSAVVVLAGMILLLALNRNTLADTVVNEQLTQGVMTVLGTALGLSLLLGIDHLVKKWLLA
jgi:nitrate reductase gamma subunit